MNGLINTALVEQRQNDLRVAAAQERFARKFRFARRAVTPAEQRT